MQQGRFADGRWREAARRRGALRIAGLDEVGRGPLFGPVVAAAVILPKGCRLRGLTDSKKLTEKKRNELDAEIRAKPWRGRLRRWMRRRSTASTSAGRRCWPCGVAVEQLALAGCLPGLSAHRRARHHRLAVPAAGGDWGRRASFRLRRRACWRRCIATGCWWSWTRCIPATGWRGTRATARRNTWRRWRGWVRRRCTGKALQPVAQACCLFE